MTELEVTTEYFFDYKGGGGPTFSTEKETLDYIDNDLLRGEPKDPSSFTTQVSLNGATLVKQKKLGDDLVSVFQWDETGIAFFPEGGQDASDFPQYKNEIKRKP